MTNFPAHVIERSELRVLPSGSGQSRYQLQVGLPQSYGQDRAQRYPVVYVTDGYWSFPMIAKMRDLLFFDRAVPEFIVVGLGYVGENLDYDKLRWNELSPAPMPDAPESTGHAAAFLRTIEADVIPFVEREYRADPARRVLVGCSLGGLFTLFALYTVPRLFQGYIAATPAVMVGNDWIFRQEEAFAATGQTLEGRLYLSVGSEEFAQQVEGVTRFHERIVSRRHDALACALRVIDGEGHCGGIFEAYVRGLRYVFETSASDRGERS